MSKPRALHDLFEDLAPLRTGLAFRLLSARRRGGGRSVLVVPVREFARAKATRALERAAEAHARIAHPAVPATRALLAIDGRPVLELDCPAIADGLELFRRLVSSGTRIPYVGGDGFIVGLREALEAAHRVTDPRTGRPTCLGRLSPASVLFDAAGRSYLVGFGHNVAIDDEDGHPDPRVPHHEAPEVVLGGDATPSGDYVALIRLMRASIPLVDRSDALGRILRGVVSNSDRALIELVRWFDQRVLGEAPAARPTIDEAVAQSDRIRAILGVVPEPAVFEAVAAAMLGDPRLEAPIEADARAVLTIGAEGAWVRWRREPPVRLRGPMRRLLLALAEKQLLGVREPVRSVDLVELGWPDERIAHDAALNRVYVTLSRLRRALPDGVVERFDDGYRLRADVQVERSAAPDP